MGRIWEDLLTEQERILIEKGGYATRGCASWSSRGLGTRPVCLVIDMQEFIVGRNVPILQAIKDHPTAMGEIAWKAMEHIVPLVKLARELQVPIMYTRVVPQGCRSGDRAVQIVADLAPEPGDVVVEKNFASAFYGTALATHLVQRRIDTVIAVGNSTSGCLRATAIDAMQLGFKVVVPEECTFDRIAASHKASLLDLWMKYAEVISKEQVVAYLLQLNNTG